MTEEPKDEMQFAVGAQVDGYPKPLVLVKLTFARLMDDVVVPYQSGDAFFVDGVPVTPNKLKRIKILQQVGIFDEVYCDLHHRLRWGDINKQKLYAEQYHVRLEALMRECGEDVTSQILKAYDAKIKPSLKDYIPKRDDLIAAAMQVFIQGMKALGPSQ